MNFQERRLWPRISWNFIIKFRQQKKPEANWEVSLIQNISKGGCYCFGRIPLELGEILDIEIQFPTLEDPMKFVGEVKRCERSRDKNLAIHGIGIQFTEMDEGKRDTFYQTLDFFLKKQSQS